jgi:homogentisate 1,2-dioxygenase
MRGRRELFCDYGHLELAAGDYVVLPRGTMWRLEVDAPVQALLIEATNDSYRLPEKGMLGPHAIFDEAMLDTPAIDDAFLAQQDEREWRVEVKRRNQVSVITYPWNPLDAVGWKGDLAPVRINWRAIRPADVASLSPAALGAHHFPGRALRGLHLRAAAFRERSGRAQGPVLSTTTTTSTR